MNWRRWAAKSHAKFVVFNGHIHNYERFEMNGIMHVITGGGGLVLIRFLFVGIRTCIGHGLIRISIIW